jgi:hypothetical protein
MASARVTSLSHIHQLLAVQDAHLRSDIRPPLRRTMDHPIRPELLKFGRDPLVVEQIERHQARAHACVGKREDVVRGSIRRGFEGVPNGGAEHTGGTGDDNVYHDQNYGGWQRGRYRVDLVSEDRKR